MYKYRIITFFIFFNSFRVFAQLDYLKVSPNGRYLVKDDGKETPFFWMGDTGWKLLKLSRENIDHYLESRAIQGFNVIQGPVIAQKYYDGPFEPDAYNQFPFTDPADPLSFNEAYFRHVDYAVDKAASLGLYIALVPMWAQGLELYSEAQLKDFGRKMGQRYGNKKNVLWVAGGEAAGEATPGRTHALATGLEEGSKGKQLITVHPNGKKSSSSGTYKTAKESGTYNYHSRTWLDFNMLQSGHNRDFKNYRLVTNDYRLQPVKPVLEAEYFYEDHPNWADRNKLDVPRAGELDSRTGGYWAVFSGSMGYTYGHHAVWLFYEKDEKIRFTKPSVDWKTALASPGARSITHLRFLMESRPFQQSFPAQELLVGLDRDSAEYSMIRLLRDGKRTQKDASFILAYIPHKGRAEVNTTVIKGKKLNVSWFDPATGNTYTFLKKVKNPGKIEILPDPFYKDRVLLVDDASKKYKAPRQRKF